MKMDGTKIVYEVGDWVTSGKGEDSGLFITGTVGRICNCNGDYWVDRHTSPTTSMKELCIGTDKFRLATQEEINKATEEEKIMVGGHEVVFDFEPKEWIRIGCVTVSKELFLKIGKKAGWL